MASLITTEKQGKNLVARVNPETQQRSFAKLGAA